MSLRVEIYTEYKCSKGHKWSKYWRRYPWFDNYSTNCPQCGQSKWPRYKYDNSVELPSEWKKYDN
jgi:hypothetical protein